MRGVFDSAPEGSPKRCAWLADAIITERTAALESYIKYAECWSVGDADGCEFYASQVAYSCSRAVKLRNDFFDKYHL